LQKSEGILKMFGIDWYFKRDDHAETERSSTQGEFTVNKLYELKQLPNVSSLLLSGVPLVGFGSKQYDSGR